MNSKLSLISTLLIMCTSLLSFADTNSCLKMNDPRINYSFLMKTVIANRGACVDRYRMESDNEIRDFLKVQLNRPVSRKELIDYEIAEVMDERAKNQESIDKEKKDAGVKIYPNPCDVNPRFSQCREKDRGAFYHEVFERVAKKEVDAKRARSLAVRANRSVFMPDICIMDPYYGLCGPEKIKEYRLEILKERTQFETDYFYEPTNQASSQGTI